MVAQIIIKVIFITAGIISTLAGLFNWKWFFKAANSKLLVNSIGYNTTRILYILTGAVMLGIAFFVIP